MGNRLRDLRLSCGATPQELVDAVRELYPKYDKPLQSKCEHTDLYAVELTYPAFSDLFKRFDPEGWAKYKRHTDGHKMTFRIYGRLPSELGRRFMAQLNQDGYKSVQDWILDHVMCYVYMRSDDS